MKYISFEAAIVLIDEAREFQTKAWPSTQLENAGDRPFEEWVILMDVYLAKLKQVYAETPAYINDGTEPNIEGRKRIEKYAAVLANLAVWSVQAARVSH